MYRYFSDQIRRVSKKEGPIVISMTTPGGDPDAARRMALEVRLLHEKKERDVYFIGKTTIYSAGVVFMAAFPKKYRYLTDDAMLLIHERSIDKQVRFTGPVRLSIAVAEEMLSQFRTSQMLENRDFMRLAKGSKLSGEALTKHAMENWYVSAQEALKLGLVQGII